jgi:hypothetical protein
MRATCATLHPSRATVRASRATVRASRATVRASSAVHRASAAALLLAALACEPEGPAPYGFEALPEQAFRFEARDQTEIDGTRVSVERLADLRLIGKPLDGSRTELAIHLSRFYMRIEGAPGGTTELAISEKGLVTRGTGDEDLSIVPDSAAPEEESLIGRLLEDPLGGCILDGDGARLGTSWRSRHPVLSGLEVLDWVMLALPIVDPGGGQSWSGARSVPPIGQYAFGIEIPIRYRREAGDPLGTGRVLSSGVVRRSHLEVAPGLAGSITLDFTGEAELGTAGRVRRARGQLLFEFNGDGGTRVSSRHQVQLSCLDCDNPVNPPAS